MSFHDPQTWSDGLPVGGFDLNREVRDNLQYLYSDTPPTREVLWHENSFVISGNAITRVVDGGQWHSGVSYQTAATAIGDSFMQSVVLAPGSYTLTFILRTEAGGGIFKAEMGNNTVLSSVDTYTVGTVNNAIATGFFATTEFKRQVLTATVTGKNGSSSGYRIALTCIQITPYPTEDF